MLGEVLVFVEATVNYLTVKIFFLRAKYMYCHQSFSVVYQLMHPIALQYRSNVTQLTVSFEPRSSTRFSREWRIESKAVS